MNISEDNFISWSKGPSQTEADKCESAERAVRKAIKASKLLNALDTTVFAQGSYRARTNVRQNSDVDICIRYNSTFFASYTNGLTPEMVGNSSGTMMFSDFKDMVQRALNDYFGKTDIIRGDKAFNVRANSHRINADVVPTFEYRKYTGMINPNRTYHYLPGVAFNSDLGNQIINWPEQTYSNGINKNKITGRKYKRVIRIMKRLRDRMRDDGIDVSHEISSFLIECLVWNADIKVFGYDNYTAIIRYLIADIYNRTLKDNICLEWLEVNEMKYLFHYAQPWTREKANDFLQIAWEYIGYR